MRIVYNSMMVCYLVLAAVPGIEVYESIAAHYRPELMNQVATNQGMEVVPCMVSSSVWPLHTWVVLVSQKNGSVLLCRVTDQSHPKDGPRHRANGMLIELDFNSAQILCETKFYGDEPPRACPLWVYSLN